YVQMHKTALIECHVSGMGNTYIHWYQQKSGRAPERILYLSSGKNIFDKESSRGKFEAYGDPSKDTYALTVKQINKDDAATYYCAYWDDTVLTKHRAAVQKPQPVKHSTPHLFP
uniref:Ig-like domain-containing protein n=1 Tax=Crocodylus porosus TaxID=8502 RepID=A0A7M4EVM1_CROPO